MNSNFQKMAKNCKKKPNIFFWDFKKESIKNIEKTLESHRKVQKFVQLSNALLVKFTVLEKSWTLVWIEDLGRVSTNKIKFLQISLESLQNNKYATSELQY